MIKNIDNQACSIPRHVAIIMDGNGRWAAQNGRPRLAGHRAGVKSARRVVEACAEARVETLTLFAFSSENWQRPAEEVNALMRLFIEVLQREVSVLHDNGIRLRFIGARDNLPTILQKRIEDAENKTAANSRMTLMLAVAFGGRWDITQAIRQIAAKVDAGELKVEGIDEAMVSRHLSLALYDDPDLLIRTGGEKRVSNFLLWNLAYSEIHFTDTLWPVFDSVDLASAFEFFRQRQRRFGQLGNQKEAGAD
ncbi:MAG: polyprenyl diphosphate synthase [Gammaproteobacteria bacterium]|jgi:undecaprenyl diphosphate synthase|nr:di-trans,poly-cis-decaprenylcistransferase [Chromatiales bacterium]MCP4925968.1 di-trans,poly-cis-decaprenylcistransferase [Gammaproteobacteria bacterium]MDP7297633.1 polyprenyl diphosphate synthase [Gammaproteobacteria bacterium]MDP7419498.1 polyprenyl diphosphate synthase [Gammaproteobacteria bacterium]MDP7660462.1 polyprenyl diphosphate synthase [Gammaproteobacteria bacterium]